MDTPDTQTYIEALRQLIRTGATGASGLEHSPLTSLPVVYAWSGSDATPAQRAYMFVQVLRHIIRYRLEGKEAQIAAILFGLEGYAGLPMQERYRAAAKLHNQRGTWEKYRKEPLTRLLSVVGLALEQESRREPPSGAVAAPPRVLIVQNITHERPGLLRKILKEVAVAYDIVDLSRGEALPNPARYAAMVVLGGPASANNQTPAMTAQLACIKQALDAGVPYLGICLGLQAAVKAAGGAVVQGVKEVGLTAQDGSPYRVSLTELALTALGRKDPLFLGLRDDFRVFQLHSETVTLAPGMQLLATGRDCYNQIVKIRPKAYGIQSHFELDRDMLLEWLRIDPDLTPLDKEQVLAEFAEIEELYTITGLSLLRNFLHIAGAI